MVERISVDACLRQTVADRLRRETGTVLDAPKALLLGRGDQLAIGEQAGGGASVIGVDSQDVHKRLPGVSLRYGWCGGAL